MPSPLEVVESIARRRGYEVEVRGRSVIVKHPEAPIELVVTLSGGSAEVMLQWSGSLRDYLRDLEDEATEAGEAREQLESILDDLSMLAFEVTEALRRAGVSVRSNVREKVMDVLEALEEIEEE